MDKLLPHYERELSLLREKSQSFAQRYPKVAGALQLRGDTAQDPHVERMVESFALLAARVHKRLDDDFPLFTESLLEVLYPHYLRPFPSSSVVQFNLGPVAGQMSKAALIERGTMMTSRPVRGVPCKFRTTQDVVLLPVQVMSVAYRNSIVAPEGSRMPAGATSVISMTLELLSPQASWGMLNGQALRFYLDGEPSQVSVLREALSHKVLEVMVQTHAHHPWQAADANVAGAVPRPAQVGFADDEALIDFDARSHPAYRLLTEYFAFPEKFNFIDIPVPIPAAWSKAESEGGDGVGGKPRRLTVHLVLSGVRSDSDESRLLEAVNARNLLLGCAPVVNLFRQPADPIRLTHAASAYPVLVDGRRAFGYEVYAIDRVFRVRQTSQGETVQEFRPFFSLQHEDLLGAFDDAPPATGHEPTAAAAGLGRSRVNADGEPPAGGRYWSVHRDEDLAVESPGYETELSIVDIDFDPASPHADTLSLTVTATNRDLPSLLTFGSPGGDLFLEGGGVAKDIRLLRKPTQTHRFERDRGMLWRLISHLSLNHLSLSGGGIDALQEMLRLYDLPRSATNRRQIDGLVAVEFKPATAWLPGEPYATFVRGTEVRLMVDEDGFVGTGLGLFASVLDHFFGLYVHANSFTKLTLISARTQEEVLSCPPRNGQMPLV